MFLVRPWPFGMILPSLVHIGTMIAGNIPGKTPTLALAIYDAFQAGNDLQASWLVVITSAVCVSLLMAAELLVKFKRRR